MIKKIGIGVGVLLLLIILISVIGLMSLGSFVTPNFIVKQIESSMNVRAEVKKVNISLFSALSSVGIEGIKLGRRDAVADAGTDLDKREDMKSSVISLEKIDLGLSLGAILSKEFRLNKLILNEPKVSLVLFENGSNSLSPLFQPPITVNGEPNPKLSPEAIAERIKAEKELEGKKLEEVESKEPFTIKSIPISISMGELGIKNGNISVTMQKTKQVINLTSATILLKNLDIVPDNLEKHNSVNLDLSFNLSVIGANSKESALFLLNSSGKIQPFETKTGLVNPSVVHSVKIKEGTYMNGFAAFDALAGGLPALNSLNIKMDKIAQKVELQKDVQAKIGYTQGKVIFKDSPNFTTKHYDLKIMEGTWIQLTNSTHSMNAKIVATKQESDKALAGINKALEGAKGVDTTVIKKEILGNLMEGDRVALPFKSTGSIKSPNVSLGINLPSIAGLLKGAVKDALKGKIPDGAKDALKKFGF
ncbi:MAG: AsmA domain protein [Leptospira sp.]|nr:AsmA domain protein [Leptospira sp.]